MSQGLLKWLRLIIPGLLMYLVIPPLFIEEFDLGQLLDGFTSLEPPVVAVVLGGLYEILNARWLVWHRPLNRVNDNIKSRLIGACSGDLTISHQADRLRQGRQLMHVFYGYVDRDPSLQEKAKRVRFNGVLWTTVIDAITISAFSAVVYVGAYLSLKRPHLLVMAAVLLGGLVLCIGLLPLVTRRHLDLSNEQLEIIEQRYRQELCAEIHGLTTP